MTCKSCGERVPIPMNELPRCDCHSCSEMRSGSIIARWASLAVVSLLLAACYGCWMEYRYDMDATEKIRTLIQENPQMLDTHRVDSRYSSEVIRLVPLEEVK
jgi:hypothetical protein